MIEVNRNFLVNLNENEFDEFVKNNHPYELHLYPEDFTKGNVGNLGEVKGNMKYVMYASGVVFHDGYGTKKILKNRNNDTIFNDDYINN